MAEPKAQSIEKIASREGDLVGIYRQICPVLKGVDRSNLHAAVITSLENLDPPGSIHPAKAAAILKAILEVQIKISSAWKASTALICRMENQLVAL